jgi:hypothetical protein
LEKPNNPMIAQISLDLGGNSNALATLSLSDMMAVALVSVRSTTEQQKAESNPIRVSE